MERIRGIRQLYWHTIARLAPHHPSLTEQMRGVYKMLMYVWGIGGTILIFLGFLAALAIGGYADAVFVAIAVFVIATGIWGAVVLSMVHLIAVQPITDLVADAQQASNPQANDLIQPHGSVEFQQLRSVLANMAAKVAGVRAREAQDAHEEKNREATLRYILQFQNHAGGSLNLKVIVSELAEIEMQIGGYRYAQVHLIDEVNGSIRLEHSTVPPKLSQALALKSSKEGKAALHRAIEISQAIPYLMSDQVTHGLAVPFSLGLSVIGVVELMDQANLPIVEDSITAMEIIAQYAATSIVAARLHKEVEARSEIDGLTRILNRRKLDQDLRGEIARSVRYGHPLSLLMIDVDHFKKVNDTYGHQQGDEVLKLIAATLTASSRETDSAYRYGGEEFALVLRETTIDAARDAAERFRTRVEKTVTPPQVPTAVTVSIGVSSVSDVVNTIDALVEHADAALYKAKESGRNCVVVNQAVTKQ